MNYNIIIIIIYVYAHNNTYCPANDITIIIHNIYIISYRAYCCVVARVSSIRRHYNFAPTPLFIVFYIIIIFFSRTLARAFRVCL